MSTVEQKRTKRTSKVGVAARISFFIALLMHSAAWAKVSIHRQVQYFTIQAEGAEGIRSALLTTPPPGAPAGKGAATSFELTPELQFRSVASGECQTVDVNVELKIVMYLPTLDTKSDLLAAKWRRYSTALRLHEENHVRIAIKYAYRIEEELRTIVADDCRALNSVASTVYRILIESIEREHEASEQILNLGDYFR